MNEGKLDTVIPCARHIDGMILIQAIKEIEKQCGDDKRKMPEVQKFKTERNGASALWRIARK